MIQNKRRGNPNYQRGFDLKSPLYRKCHIFSIRFMCTLDILESSWKIIRLTRDWNLRNELMSRAGNPKCILWRIFGSRDSRNELHLVSSQNTKYEQKSHRNLGSSPSRISYLPLRDLIRFTTAKNLARTEKINRRSTVAKRAKILKEDPSYMNPINYPPQKIERRFSEEEPPSLSNHFSQRGKQTIPC